MRTLAALALALSFAATPALAFHCPADMAKIDAAMKTASLSEADKTKVMELRAQGEALHKEGKHQESVDTLAQALKILGM
ncbi:MAG: hypothetical protein AB7O39_13650 [Flavobacteriaceae bacterium]